MDFELTIQDIPHYTYKDYEKWEGDWELIRGIPYAMSPAPNWKYQGFGSTFLYYFKEALLKTNQCNCIVLYESDWIVSEDTVVRPDVMIVCEPIQGEYVTKPPALILEILSPSSILKDRNTKFNLYRAYGVRYYLIANVEKDEMEIFHLKDNRYQQADISNKFQLTTNCAVEVNVQNLFALISP
jgi:Uma2 family endonuclease